LTDCAVFFTVFEKAIPPFRYEILNYIRTAYSTGVTRFDFAPNGGTPEAPSQERGALGAEVKC